MDRAFARYVVLVGDILLCDECDTAGRKPEWTLCEDHEKAVKSFEELVNREYENADSSDD